MVFKFFVLASLAAVVNSQCVVCGEGKKVTKPSVVWQLPGQPAVQCGLLETVGEGGLIPDSFCGLLPALITEPCGCESTSPVAPVAPSNAPVSAAPVIPPTNAPIVPPTKAPVVPPTDSPVVPPTDAPVVPPTDAPVVPPTDAPVSVAPVVALTDAPVAAATEPPVASATAAPVVAPTKTPVVSPTDAPVDVVPTTEAPATDVPMTDVPATDVPMTDVPATGVPMTDPPATSIPMTAPPVTDAPAGCTDIVTLVCSTNELSDLCSAVQAADLVDDLRGVGTAFAPTNKAFKELGRILGDISGNTELLADILSFHAVGKIIRSKDLECKETITMMNGQDTRTVCEGKNIFQKGGGNPRNDKPKIIEADIETCQGYVHVIDEVMIPGILKSPPPTPECKTLAQLFCDHESTSSFCGLATSFNLTEIFNEEEGTLFIPNDAAFESLEAELNSTGVELDLTQTLNVLAFHALEDKVLMAQELKCGKRYKMDNGQDSRYVCRGDGKYMRGGGNILSDFDAWPEIIDADITGCNGVIHILDGVMLPRNYF